MKYIIKPTNQFKKDFKKIKNHLLIGNYKGKHECHLEPDWLLIYEYLEDELILFLTRTGSHSDLF